MKRNPILFAFFLFAFYATALHSQSDDSGKREKDGFACLKKAWEQYDSSKFETALATANMAERLLTGIKPDGDTTLSDLYGLKCIILAKKGSPEKEGYFEKMAGMLPRTTGVRQAGLYFYTGLYYQQQQDNSAENIQRVVGNYIAANNQFEQLADTNNVLYARLNNNLGVLLLNVGRYDQAVELLDKAEAVINRIYGRDHPLMAFPLSNRGMTNISRGAFSSAISDLERAREIREYNYDPAYPKAAANFDYAATILNLGIVYTYMGNISEGEDNFYKVLDIAEKSENDLLLSRAYANLGIVFRPRGELQKSLEFYERARALEEKVYPAGDPETIITFYNIATVYKDLGNFDEALPYYRKALEYSGEQDPNYTRYLNGVGLSYMRTGKLAEAEPYFRKALERDSAMFGLYHAATALSYANLTELNSLKRDYDQTMYWNERTLKCYGYHTGAGLDDLAFPLDVSFCLSIRNWLLWHAYESSNAKDPAEPDHIIANCDTVMNILNQLSSTYSDPKSRQNLKELVQVSYETGIKASAEAYNLTHNEAYQEKAFYYAEAFRSTILLDAFLEANARKLSGIPEKLLEEEEKLRVEISMCDLQARVSSPDALTGLSGEMTRSILARRKELKGQYRELISKFEREYPDYYELRHGLKTVDLKTLQKSVLRPGQTALLYFQGLESVFIFAIDRNEVHIEKISLAPMLEHHIRQLRTSLSQAWPMAKTEEQNNLYIASATWLYDQLIRPVKSYLKRELLIIPGGATGYLPFEVLLAGRPEDPARFEDYTYLLQQHIISYNYSASLLKSMQEGDSNRKNLKSVIAIAPFSDSGQKRESKETATETRGDILGPLEKSGEEVRYIAGLLEGKSLEAQNATIEKFKETAREYQILHLTTHAILNEKIIELSFLAFSKSRAGDQFEKLFIRDIYDIPLNADLVVLSACQSGIGELQIGEGIISLARAFAFAGAKSLITTLWNVNDYSGRYLMERFYFHLKSDGMRKDEALRQAKLDYLKEYNKRAFPYKWAAFIGIGDMGAMY
ncbi:MAG TPA: CHAT domain-containing protein [Flavilitoribacter sp.]|nr:CHAT domain-containing protein [Flavilitoribacter sp.]